MATPRNIKVYYDRDTDPSNPGYVVSYDTEGLGGRDLTAALDAVSRDEAIAEASALLGVDPALIEVQD